MFETKKRRKQNLLLASALAALAGCGGVYDASVEGLVTLDGSPIPAGSVAFIPSSGGSPAYAQSDSSGRYEVYTGKEAGLPPGKYDVTVVARAAPTEKRSKSGGPPPPGKQITPPWYGSSKSSPLNYTVESGSNEIDIALTSVTPADWNPKGRRR